MSFTRPSLRTLRANVQAAIQAEFSSAETLLRRALGTVLATVVAGAVHLVYGYLDWVSKQLFLSTAAAEYLDQQAREYGLARKAAVAATGNITLTGQNGRTLAIGALLTRSDGATYSTLADATIASGTATVAVKAVVTGGTVSGGGTNAAAGVLLTLTTAVPGITGQAAVATGGLSGGADQEGDEDLRARVLQRKRNPPQGGSKADYEAWALAQPGVTRAWVYPTRRGPGTVDLAFVCDGRDDIIPTSDDRTAMQAAIDLLRPVGMSATGFQVRIITAAPADFTVTAIDTLPAATQAAMQTAWNTQVRRDGAPDGTVRREALIAALTGAAGGRAFRLTVPSGDLVAGDSEILTPGTGTFA